MAKEIHTIPSTTEKKQVFCSDQATPAGTGYAVIESILALIGAGGALGLGDTILTRSGGTGVPTFKTYAPTTSGWTNTEYIIGRGTDYDITAQQVADRKNLVFLDVTADFDINLPAVDMGTPTDETLAGIGIFFGSSDGGGPYTLTLKPQAGESLLGSVDGAVEIPGGGFIWVDNYTDTGDWTLFTSNFGVDTQQRGSLVKAGAGAAIAVSTTPVIVAPWGSSFATDKGMTVDNAAGTITVDVEGIYRIIANVSVEYATADLSAVLYINGSAANASCFLGDTVSGENGSVYYEGAFQAGDVIDLRLVTAASSGSATFETGQLIMETIGGQSEAAAFTQIGGTIVTVNSRPNARMAFSQDFDAAGTMSEQFATPNFNDIDNSDQGPIVFQESSDAESIAAVDKSAIFTAAPATTGKHKLTVNMAITVQPGGDGSAFEPRGGVWIDAAQDPGNTAPAYTFVIPTSLPGELEPYVFEQIIDLDADDYVVLGVWDSNTGGTPQNWRILADSFIQLEYIDTPNP